MGTLVDRNNLHGRSQMQTVSHAFRKTPWVQGLQQVTVVGLMGVALFWAVPASAQNDWRTVPSVAHTSPGLVVTPIPASAPVQPKAEAAASVEAGLQMFGVRLVTATRDEMRQAIRQEGLKVQREDGAFQEDIYEAPNLMPGLLQLKFSYAPQGQRLSQVDYVFMTFSDNAHVEDVKLRIEARFGKAQRVTGREESGPYQAVWRLPDQMEIWVAREWPQKTTQLRFVNAPVLRQTQTHWGADGGQAARHQKIQNSQALPFWVAR